jgi:hypothetical protein
MSEKQPDAAAIAAKKEKRNEYLVAYRAANSEKARLIAWRSANSEKIKIYQSSYRAANREEINARQNAKRAAKKLKQESAEVNSDDRQAT